MEIRHFTVADRDPTIQLWHGCGLLRPWNDPEKDIERKLTTGRQLFLVGFTDGELMASLMGGYEGHRGWMNYLAVAPSHRGKGHARALVTRLENDLIQLGCPKLNLQIRSGNEDVLDFYRHLGFEPDQATSMGKRLIADN